MLTKQLKEAYEEKGYLLVDNLFTTNEIDLINEEAKELQKQSEPDVILEDDQKSVRALLGSHLKSELYQRLIAQSRLVQSAQQILGDEVYVYQFKINRKPGFSGQVWPWHQDFIYWAHLDGMLNPNAVNIAIFLDDCTEFNGSLWVIPESHKKGMIESKSNDSSGDWQSAVSANLTYQVSNEETKELIDAHGIVAPKGKAGSVLLFHPNIVHASPPNISSFSRKLMIITYNSIGNVPQSTGKERRPSFLVSPYTKPQLITDQSL